MATDSQAPQLQTSTSHTRARSTPSPDPSDQPPTTRRRHSHIDYDYIDIDSDDEPDYPPSQQLISFGIGNTNARPDENAMPIPENPHLVPDPSALSEILPLESWHRASGLELSIWVRNILGGLAANIVPIQVEGPSVDAIALTLCSLIQSNGTESLLILEPKVMCSLVSDLGLLATGRMYTVHHPDAQRYEARGEVPPHPASGQGPERTVHTRAIELRANDLERWRESTSGTFMQPNFHDNTSTTPARRDAFYVDGRYAALYIISQAAGPSPISPFVIFAATQMSRKALGELSLSLIHVLDPTSARILHPWFDVLPDTTWLPNNIATTPWAAAVHMLLEHYLPDLPEDWLSQRRTQVVHNDVHERLLEAFFLGLTDAWGNEEFQAFQRGQRLQLGPPANDYSPAPTLGDHWAAAFTVARYLVALYDRQVKNPEDLISHLQIITDATAAITNPVSDLYIQLFKWRLHRWLSGSGYPPELKGVYVSDAEYDRHRGSAAIRAARLLYSLTESYTLPASPSTQLKLDLRAEIELRESYDDQKAVFWHSCMRSAEIFFTPWLKNILLEPGNLEDLDAVYRFDLGMSRVTCLKGGDYNRF
ncbi:hypothetical protein DFH08DRAFT_102355 [Mycena albidolilacea]|uniref:Uncharacterized protein n=1 Tax=Mycena albidolilacea TaxID=1033008 RepID=A0AAD7E7V2_9AGAR|nr:hypothetical protein DFH08DRAFT_102355 [Mycena albidolilacea]